MGYKSGKYIIAQRWIEVFNKQLKWRGDVYGNPLSTIQKIKSARAVSHQIFPTDLHEFRGKHGHMLREKFRKEILKSVGIEYKK